MPNKTMHVSDDDLELYHRAQEVAGGNLSQAIVAALRRYVDIEEGRREGFDEVIVRVGPGVGGKVRFAGILLAEWGHSRGPRSTASTGTCTGKYVLHTQRSPEWTVRDADGEPAGWLAQLTGLGGSSWSATYADATLDVVDSLEALREKIPLRDLRDTHGLRRPAAPFRGSRHLRLAVNA